MIRHIHFTILFLGLLSCKDFISIDEIDRSKFCQYFSLKSRTYTSGGKVHKSVSTKINELPNDKISEFIQNYKYRFDYLINKTFSNLYPTDPTFDSTVLSDRFCKAILNDSFYNHFIALTNVGKLPKNTKSAFSISELMMVASRFFMCDNVRIQDTAIYSRICVGINGISELKKSKDYTVLEAFSFEAIFRTMKSNPKYMHNFQKYVVKASQEQKKRFTSFQDHLIAVRESSYTSMENDKDLQKALLKYYKQNHKSLNFIIE